MYTFDLVEADINKTDPKAANIGFMMRSGLPVPPGFVISSNALNSFLKENKLEEKIQSSDNAENLILNSQIPGSVRSDIISSYEKLSFGNELRDITGKALDIIRTGRDNVFVSVRSSAFDGRSYLGVVGSERLLNAVMKCWAGIYNAEEKSIIVQKMVNPEKSGTIFTKHPITGDGVLIEAYWGFGQTLSSGVSADAYIIDKYSGDVVDKKIAKKTMMLAKDELGNIIKRRVSDHLVDADVLSGMEIKKLLEILPRLGEDNQISWCIERGKVLILGTKQIKRTENLNAVDGKEIESGTGLSSGTAKGRVSTSFENPDGKIIAAKGFDKNMVPFIRKASGLISEIGCFSSDASFVAREIGIPYILVPNIEKFNEGQEVLLDGLNGKIYVEREEQESPTLPGSDSGKIITATEIVAIVSSNTNVSVDSCVINAENMFLEKGKHPIYLAKTNPDEMIGLLVEFVGGIARVFYPKPVWYKSLDFRTDEFQNFDSDEDPNEENPILGWHGIRRSLDEIEVLKCEAEVLKRLYSKGINNIGFLLPFVVNPDEVESVKEVVDTKIGICVETPAAALNIDSFDVDYVLINCDTLAQLVLGVDKGNPNVSHLYSDAHSSVLKLVKNVVDLSKANHVSISAASILESGDFIEKVVSFGVDSIATDAEKTERLKYIVARSERKLLLEKLK